MSRDFGIITKTLMKTMIYIPDKNVELPTKMTSDLGMEYLQTLCQNLMVGEIPYGIPDS